MSKTGRLEFVVAGDKRDAIEEEHGTEAWRLLADNGFVERKSVTCVGFRRNIERNSLLVVLPKAFNCQTGRKKLKDQAYQREQIYRLIRAFKKIRSETAFNLEIGTTNIQKDTLSKISDPVLDSFDAAIRLRNDYRECGAYVRKKSKRTTNAPHLPLNWQKTYNRSTTLLVGGDILFDRTVHHSRKRDMSHPLSLLHTSCLKEILKLTGERSPLDLVDALDEKTFRSIKSKPKQHLRSLRRTLFDERGRSILNLISAYFCESRLKSTDRSKTDELLSYTKDFEDIWEQVLRDLLAPGLKERTLPPGHWYSWPECEQSVGMRPEFDIRLGDDDSDVLVDAKDYRLFNGSKWIGSNSDHYKQIIYRKLLQETGERKVFNILAFPNLGQKTLFEVRGCHHWADISDSMVFEITVDYDLAIKRWLREISLEIKSETKALLATLKDFSKKLER